MSALIARAGGLLARNSGKILVGGALASTLDYDDGVDGFFGSVQNAPANLLGLGAEGIEQVAGVGGKAIGGLLGDLTMPLLIGGGLVVVILLIKK